MKNAPLNIWAVRFTNKAAGERLQRVPLIAAFDGLCVRILRQDIEAMKAVYTKPFSIYDTDDLQKAIKSCLKDLAADDKISYWDITLFYFPKFAQNKKVPQAAKYAAFAERKNLLIYERCKIYS